jgi:uncharacterized protein (TIGR03083 family)
MSSPTGADLVRESYAAFAGVLRGCDDDGSWAPTGCRGWSVRDLTFHCVGDAQRALVALHTPTDDPADRDAATYWQDWRPDEEAAARGRRFNRVGASMFLLWDQLRDLYLETSTAVVHALTTVPAGQRIRTQGHVLTADDLARTLSVEATLHHLDLLEGLPQAQGPATTALHEVRRVLDALVGEDVARSWADERYARVATGRAEPTPEEAAALGAVADRFPLFS